VIDVIPPEAFLEGYPDDIRAMAETLRGVVRRAVPEATERVRAGWRIIGYDLPIGKRGVYFAFVAPEPKHVHLGWAHGIHLEDPEQRLEGAHLRLRTVRYVTFRPGDEIDEAPLLAFTRDAARVASLPREARLALALDRD
jgi:hypothetical protein